MVYMTVLQQTSSGEKVKTQKVLANEEAGIRKVLKVYVLGKVGKGQLRLRWQTQVEKMVVLRHEDIWNNGRWRLVVYSLSYADKR